MTRIEAIEAGFPGARAHLNTPHNNQRMNADDWIKIEPGCRMPKDGETYLCVWDGKRTHLGCGPVDKFGERVTHWMPIVPPEQEPNKWSRETMRIINDLTKDIKDKSFDPGWFLLRERLEAVDHLHQERDTLTGLLREIVEFEQNGEEIPQWVARWQKIMDRARAAMAHASRDDAKMP